MIYSRKLSWAYCKIDVVAVYVYSPSIAPIAEDHHHCWNRYKAEGWHNYGKSSKIVSVQRIDESEERCPSYPFTALRLRPYILITPPLKNPESTRDTKLLLLSAQTKYVTGFKILTTVYAIMQSEEFNAQSIGNSGQVLARQEKRNHRCLHLSWSY